MSFDNFYENSDDFEDKIMNRIRKIMEEIDKAARQGKKTGKWKVDRIDRPDVKGYVIRGQFRSGRPSKDFDSLNSQKPSGRASVPKRGFKVPKKDRKQRREPLEDVFEEEKEVKICLEMPGEDEDDIQLDVTEDQVKVKGKKFHKTVDLPTQHVNVDKVTSKYKNGVFQVSIPKKN